MAQIAGVFRIGRDTEVRFTQGGDPVASLSLAFNYGRKDQDGKRPSQWIDASLWGKRAESLAQYLTKGSQIYAVLSDPHIETYQGKNGEGHKLAATVLEIELIGGRREDAQQQTSQGTGNGDTYRAAKEGRTPPPRNDFDDSDIPFN